MHLPCDFQQQLLCAWDRDSLSCLWLITGMHTVTNGNGPGLHSAPRHSHKSFSKARRQDAMRPACGAGGTNVVIRKQGFTFLFHLGRGHNW